MMLAETMAYSSSEIADADAYSLRRRCPMSGRITSVVLAALVMSLCVQPAADAQNRVRSTKSCTRCHFPLAGDEGIPKTKETPFCTQEEAALWEQSDKHRQSIYLLLSKQNLPLTNQILGFPVTDVLQFEEVERRYRPLGGGAELSVPSITKVRFRENAPESGTRVVRDCLACHAPLAETSPEDGEVTYEFGVSCQACHGGGENYILPHEHPSRAWRVLDPRVKEADFGMIDLRHPYRRASRCADCHVGSWPTGEAKEAEGRRFVRHEWYANGHPPLPSVEYVTFSLQMPAHWRPLQEKAAESVPFVFLTKVDEAHEAVAQRRRDEFRNTYLVGKNRGPDVFAESYLAANRLAYPTQDVPELLAERLRSRDLLVSGLAVLGAYSKLIADPPSELQRDFGLFDCGACHHELRSRFPSEARVRRTLRPGRVPPADWTLTLARVASWKADATAFPVRPSGGSEAELDAAVQSLYAAFSARPFGDRELVSRAANTLSTTCETIAERLLSCRLDATDAERLLAELADPRHDEDRDYYSARQLAWAIREVMKDLADVPYRSDVPRLPRGEQVPRQQAPDRLLQAIGLQVGPTVFGDDPRVARRIDEFFGAGPWFEPLRLRLPAGQQETIVGHLSDALRAISEYDAAKFRATLEPLRKAYPR